MATTEKTIADLTAEDVMTRNVVTLSPDTSLKGAIDVLSEAGVGGAPVVDDEGRFLGVFSATDALEWLTSDNRRPRGGDGIGMVTPWQPIDADADDTIMRFVDNRVPAVRPSTPLQLVASLMSEDDLNRLVVQDGDGRPVGVVARMDLVRAVARS